MAETKTKVIIGTTKNPARSTFMFCRVLKQPEDGEGPAKGTCGILFSKKDKATLAKVEKAIATAGEKKFGNNFNASSRKYSIALKDGDELYEDPEYSVGEEAKGMWFISTTAYKVPQMVDKQGNKIFDPDELDEKMVSGNYFLFSVTFKPFDNESKGVRAELNNLMFVKEGERLDGSASAEEDFADFASDDDDFDEPEDDEDEDERPSRQSRGDRGSRRSRSGRRR